MFKLPYGVLPGQWGLKGKTREIAKAEYELTGYDLEMRLLEIKRDELDNEDDYMRKTWGIKLKYNKIDKHAYNRLLVTLIYDDNKRGLAELELDLAEGKITHLEFEKRSATIRGEPWVTVINMDFTKKSSLEGSFELDWNEPFVEKLKAEGYNAPTPDHIVNQWFMEICRNIAMEEFDGTGDFTGDSAANLETMKRWNSPESFSHGKKSYR